MAKFHEGNLVFIGNTPSYGGGINNLAINNGFIYVGGFGPDFSAGNVCKYHESNLAFVGNTVSYGGSIRAITTNDNFIYVGGATNRTVQKFQQNNFVFGNDHNTTLYEIQSLKEE